MTPLASARVGVAVKTGAPKPDISSADSVKRMLLSAKSVVYPNPARGPAAGITFDQMLITLGIAEQVKPKLKPVVGAEVMKITARGESEIAVTFLSELGTQPGIDIVGRCRKTSHRPPGGWVSSPPTPKTRRAPKRCLIISHRLKPPRCTGITGWSWNLWGTDSGF